MFAFLSAVIFLTMQCLPILNIAMFDARSMFVKNIDLDVFDDVKLTMALLLGKSKYADF